MKNITAMFSSEVGCLFMGFILHISGIEGKEHIICALKGSSVDLPCSAQRPDSNTKWYTGWRVGSELKLKELSADETRVTYNSDFTLKINNLTESDANLYCCKRTADKEEKCKQSVIQLLVAVISDLQVQVIPTTEGQTVTLMCSTSCALTEPPEVYIWYKNRESLYQNWSPWYQELVSSEEAVRYSCAIEGYEDLRAPEVSVDSVTSTCFSVTYAKGRMCSYYQTSEDEPCSIKYPRKVHVQRSPVAKSGHVRLTCNTSCPPTAFIWYKSRHLVKEDKEMFVLPNTSGESFSCAVKGFEDLRSSEVCVADGNCWTVNYASWRICALGGSSVNISSYYAHGNFETRSKSWYKINRTRKGVVEEPVRPAGRVEYHDKTIKDHHILTINRLKKNDSAEYIFKLQEGEERWKPGVTLVVTGLKVKFAPSAVVTEDQRVTLTCSTSCPLTNNTNYIWFFNSRPLTLTEHQNKHLVLDPVSSQHAGNYSCAAKTPNNNRSNEKTLTVIRKSGKLTTAAAAGVCVPLLVLIPLFVFLWFRRKRTSSQSARAETSDNLEQLNPEPVYMNSSNQPTEKDDLHYSSISFSNTSAEPLYSTVQPHPPQEQQHSPYAVVNLKRNMTPE